MNKKELEKIKEFNKLHEERIKASKKFVSAFVISWALLLSAYGLQTILPVFFVMFALAVLGFFIFTPYFGYHAFYSSWKVYKFNKENEK